MSGRNLEGIIVGKIKENVERMKRNIYLRDKFIIEKGLWEEFLSQLPPSQAKGE